VLPHKTVGLRRRRFLERGISGLYDGLRPGLTRPIPPALHSDRYLLAQSWGDLVSSHHAASHSPRDFSQREGTERKNRAPRARLQPPGPVVRLDCHTGLDRHQNRTTTWPNIRDSTL